MSSDLPTICEKRNQDLEGKVGYAIGTGRCGTEFIARIAAVEPDVSSVHERNPLNETFHRYCKWYGLAVDHGGFLHTKEKEIRQDLAGHSYSFESSAYLSLSIGELYESFAAKFVLLVRRPDQLVNSYIFKGMYAAPIVRNDPDLALGYQECQFFHHFLGRFVPSGEKFLEWQAMTQVGKLAWYWNALNSRVLDQFSCIPQDHWRVVKLEELDYARYLQVADFLGFQPTIRQRDFELMAKHRPNASRGVPRTIESWTPQERAEFETEVRPSAAKLGYEYQVEKLSVPARRVRPSFIGRLSQYFADRH